MNRTFEMPPVTAERVNNQFQTTLNKLAERYPYGLITDREDKNTTFAVASQPIDEDTVLALNPQGVYVIRLSPNLDPESLIHGKEKYLLKDVISAEPQAHNPFIFGPPKYGQTLTITQGDRTLEITPFPLTGPHFAISETLISHIDHSRQQI